MRIRTHILTAIVATLALQSTLTAQTIRGSVLDVETDRPVAGATVTLLRVGDEVVRGVLTDSSGAFSIGTQRSGRYRLRAQRIGYAEVTSEPIDLVVGDSMRVELRMGMDAVALAPLTVTATSRRMVRDRVLDDFYQRQFSGWGTYYGPAEIDRLRPMTVTNLLQMSPGISIRYVGSTRRQILMRNSRGECVPTFYVDGSRLPTSEIDSWVSGGSLRAVEVYNRALEVPGEFASVLNYDCGVVVIWTDRRVSG